MFKIVLKVGGSDKIKKLTCNSCIFPFIVSSNCRIVLLGFIKLVIKRNSNKYLNYEY